MSGAESKGKPEDILAKILTGKLNKRLAEICLLTQVRCKRLQLTQ